MAQFQYDMDKNHISAIRFGNLGAAGSETWSKGCKMKPYQIRKLRELLAEQEKDVKEEKTENLENMLE